MTEQYSFREIRAVFGQNLRELVADQASVSDVCRRIGINRAQFNRYMNGESYPRPDRLKQICDFFGVDARILTEPLEERGSVGEMAAIHPEMKEFATFMKDPIPESFFPSGIFRFSRRSFIFPDMYVMNLLRVYRVGLATFMKGNETLSVARDQGLSTSLKQREYRGMVQPLESGFCTFITQRNGLTGTFNFFSPVMALNQKFWQGYAIRTTPEVLDSSRASRVVFEYLGEDTQTILATARQRGFCSEESLPSFHKRLLNLDQPFR